ncbi:MAG TPA: hypothetical protein VF092_21065 [Longimicrobium sp.]
MPKLTCICGYEIVLHGIPCPAEFALVPDVLKEPIVDKLVAAHATRGDFETRAYLALSHTETPGILQAIECRNCFCLAIFARASDRTVAYWYARESGGEGGGDPTEALASLTERLRDGKR